MDDVGASGSGNASSSPVRSYGRTQFATLAAGVLLMLATLYCNNWVLKAQSVFANLERVNSAFDSFDQSELVILYDLCDENPKEISSSDMARIFRIGKTIQTNDSLLLEAQLTATELLNSPQIPWSGFGATEAGSEDWEAKGQIGSPDTETGGSGDTGSEDGDSGTDGTSDGTKTGDPNRSTGSDTAARNSRPAKDEKEIVCERFKSDKTDLVLNYRVWNTSFAGFSNELEIVHSEPMFSGKGLGSNLVLEYRLQSRMIVVTHWLLPILNGALGAIIFCLTRMLKDRQRAPKSGEIILRMVFGGFAGLLVATLLLPSGVPLGPYAGSAPGISLLAFVFGFSIDSFIMVLERLNRLVVDSTRPKDPEG